MLKNHLTVALRSLRRHLGYTALNLVGLAVGMACCLVVLLFVRDELSYDRFHEKADRIVRIVSDWGEFSVPATSWPVVSRLETDFPELAVARLLPIDGPMRRGDQSFLEERVFVTNPAVFDVFTFPLLRGDPTSALSRPHTIVLTPAMAQKYFGDEDPIGQTLRFDGAADLEVTGVLAPIPAASHVHPDFLVSWATLDAQFDYSEQMAGNWGANGIYTYLLLPEGADPAAIEAQFPAFVDRHAGADWNGATLELQPLTSIHLHSHHNAELEPNSDVAYVYVFSLIAAFVLLIGCINYVNLATARAMQRAKEVGVRKAVGAPRGQIVRRFLIEALLVAAGALGLALGLVSLTLPLFRALTGRALAFDVLGGGPLLLALVGGVVLVGVLAGSTPAVVLARLRPIAVLRGGLPRAGRGAWLRKGLVVFQFAASVALIAGTVIAYNQLGYLRSARLGFDQERVVEVPMQGGGHRDMAHYAAFRERLLQEPAVEAVTVASTGFPSELLDGNAVGFVEADTSRGLRLVAIGHDFVEALGLELVAGRPLDRDRAADSSAYLINRAAFRLLAQDLPTPAATPAGVLGKELAGWGNSPSPGPLVGVVEDFHMATLHEAVEPTLFFISPDRRWYGTFLLRLGPGDPAPALGALREAWQAFYPEWPLEYRFADEAFDAQYRGEERLATIFALFAGIAIFVACLGLLGLAAFTVEQRTKEIGVRKVLGASVTGLVALLSKDFLVLVAVAAGVATPLAYLAATRWLDTFAYRVDLGAGAFVVAGVIALCIAVLTVSYQAVRAARRNPVESLRYE